MEINWTYASIAIVAGVLVGLYIIGKISRNKRKGNPVEPKIKISGKDMEDLENKLKEHQSSKQGLDGEDMVSTNNKKPVDPNKKNKVKFEFISNCTYENLVEWIKSVDIKDIDKESANYGCLIVRSSSDIEQFNLDISELTEDQQNHILGAMIVNTENKNVVAQRWIVYQALDDDLLNIFGEDNLKMLK